MNTFGTAPIRLTPHLAATGNAPGLPQRRSPRSANFLPHDGGAQRPGYNVFQQVLSQLILVLQLRARQEDLLQTEVQLVPGLPEEERRDRQRSIRHQRAPGWRSTDVGHCAPWAHCQGRSLSLFRHLPHNRAALLDDVVHPGSAPTEGRAD